MAISLRLNKEDAEIVKNYAELHHMTISELFRNAVMEKIEAELDLEAYNMAMKEYQVNPVTYTLDDIEKALGLK